MRRGSAIVILVAALLACARARTLQQVGNAGSAGSVLPASGGLPTTEDSPAEASPWFNFTRESNTLYIGVRQISSTTAASDEACASLCNQDLRCEWFAWCPQNVTDGCGIPGANATFTSTVAPGSCIITYDDGNDRLAVFAASGKAVPFVSGRFTQPGAMSNGTTSQSSRRLLQSGGSGTGVWANFTRVKSTFWQAIDSLPPTAAQTAEECAGACNANSTCELWTLCLPAAGAAGCEVPSFDQKASPVAVPAGTCLLSYDGTANQIAYFEIRGQNLSFEAGYRNSTDAPSPSPPAIGVPVINLPVPGISPSAPGSSPPAGGISPTPAPPAGGGISLAPANASNIIRATNVCGPKGVACATYNGTAWGFRAIDTKAWAASADIPAIDWDKALELAARLCGSPAAAGPTLLAAFEKPGSTEANIAVAAAAQPCADNVRLGTSYMRAGNPDYDRSDGSRAVEYAQKWMAAADAAGYGLCVSIGQFDADGALVPGTERFVHNPTPWNGAGSPGVTGVSATWFAPEKGKLTTCSVWNGTAFVQDTVQRPGSLASPAAVDMNELSSYLSDVCSNPNTAGATLAAALGAGGAAADLAALATIYTCGNTTAAAGWRLDVLTSDWGFPTSSQDWPRAMNFSRQWVAALDKIGYPFCITVNFWEDGRPINATQVYPGGEAPTSVSAGA